MRWLSYFILAYVMLGLQLGLGGHVQYRGGAPNFVLLAVVFVSLNAPRDEAMLGAFLLGAMQDLVTLEPMGLFALSYGLIAILVSSLGQLAYREHPLTQFFMTLVGGMITGLLLFVHGWIYPKAGHDSAKLLAASIVYTAVLAPIVIGILQRMHRMFSFEPARRKMR